MPSYWTEAAVPNQLTVANQLIYVFLLLTLKSHVGGRGKVGTESEKKSS